MHNCTEEEITPQLPNRLVKT